MTINFRPLRTVSHWLTRDMRANPTCRRHYIGLALGWMSLGYFDDRTFWQRMTDKNARYFWRRARGLGHTAALS